MNEPILFSDSRPLEFSQQELRVIEKLRRDLGRDIITALQDPTVVEVMVNPNKTLWVDRRGQLECIGDVNPGQVEILIRTIASIIKEEVGPQAPLLECELPYHGARFSGLLPPIVASPCITIRKQAEKIFTLQDYVDSKILSAEDYCLLTQAIKSRKNILVAGSTGSGKTTFCNAILAYMEQSSPDHRLVLIEDTNELQLAGTNNAIIRSNTDFTMLQALRATMRLRPDRIIVGEVRGGEALTLLKSWNTGHSGGLCTVHANSARASLIRLEQLISEVSNSPMRTLIAEAIDIVIFIRKEVRHPAGRTIEEVLELVGLDENEQYQFN